MTPAEARAILRVAVPEAELALAAVRSMMHSAIHHAEGGGSAAEVLADHRITLASLSERMDLLREQARARARARAAA